mmetsp:Transcript_8932/g.12951  ORF Transcript_8932/g.12951 Transcript_8932/m.12951 type:complete len:81 (-) Transcript_8932:383-625(-)
MGHLLHKLLESNLINPWESTSCRLHCSYHRQAPKTMDRPSSAVNENVDDATHYATTNKNSIKGPYTQTKTRGDSSTFTTP